MLLEEYYNGLLPLIEKEEPELVVDTKIFNEYFLMLLPLFYKREKLERETSPILNIWKATSLGRSELKHCDMLRWLLNPMANHSQGNRFAVHFFEKIGLSELCHHFSRPYSVQCESRESDEDRIDISIVGKEFMIWVEAKVDAGEGVDQIQRYSKLIKDKAELLEIPFDSSKLIFLTKHGRAAKTGDADIYVSWSTVAKACRQYTNKIKDNLLLGSLLNQYSNFLMEEVL